MAWILSREKTIFLLILVLLTSVNLLVFFYTQRLLDENASKPIFSVSKFRESNVDSIDSSNKEAKKHFQELETEVETEGSTETVSKEKYALNPNLSSFDDFNPSLYMLADNEKLEISNVHFNALKSQDWDWRGPSRRLSRSERIQRTIGDLPDYRNPSHDSTDSKFIAKFADKIRMEEQRLWKHNPFRSSKRRLRPGSPQNDESKVVFAAVGTSNVIHRDFALLQEAYTVIGASMELGTDIVAQSRSSHSVSNSRIIRKSGAYVLVCLSLDTSKCLSPGEFRRLESAGEVQVNRVYGLKDVLWDKGAFCSTAREGVGDAEWLLGEFTFPCWVVPTQYDELFQIASKKEVFSSSWIVKPLKMGGGKGIFVLDGLKGIENSDRLAKGVHIVQPYLPNPHLIGGRKWDLRTYVLMTSVVPMRVYMYEDGLTRFATGKYNQTASSGGRKNSFLTNTSINKHVDANMSAITWPFPQLAKEVNRLTIDGEAFNKVRLNMETSLGMLMLCAEKSFEKLYDDMGSTETAPFRCSNCYHLLGVDFILDSHYNARIIEVNGEPSMKLSRQDGSQYDKTKIAMQQDLAKLVFTGEQSQQGRLAQLVMGDLRAVVRHYRAIGLNPLDVVGVLEASEHEPGAEGAHENSLRGVPATDPDWQRLEKLLRASYMRYVLESRSEQGVLGGFRRVYPTMWPVVGPPKLRQRWKMFLTALDWKPERTLLNSLLTVLEHHRLRLCWKFVDSSLHKLMQVESFTGPCSAQLRDAIILLSGPV